uniref:hypothetical protein n=1 Tax=Bradyrhizobium sp. (strain ORS 278) TaxID=114615 RepID=UPI0012FEC00E|nr:hypothetical protein [Bradyrhizobium sp. ORS 278]
MTEGAGIDLYTADRAGQVELLNQYREFVCNQAGPSCDSNWTVFVQAGMNDIDLRCDGFLTWLDARRRDKEPIVAEISAINTAVHGVMTVTGSSPASLDIVTAIFGLASASYVNWNSRLLIAANQSTVQEIVYTSQGQFRDKIKNYIVPDQPGAIYLLRNYLRLCMPTTIEASINTSATLVQRGASVEAQRNLIVTSTKPDTMQTTIRSQSRFAIDGSSALIKAWLSPGGVLDKARRQIISSFISRENLNIQITIFLNAAPFANKRLQFIEENKIR